MLLLDTTLLDLMVGSCSSLLARGCRPLAPPASRARSPSRKNSGWRRLPVPLANTWQQQQQQRHT
jgi:hypothetical protein